jgi:hypothetical protein
VGVERRRSKIATLEVAFDWRLEREGQTIREFWFISVGTLRAILRRSAKGLLKERDKKVEITRK